uniref:Uncharacterized protein n=1 Tax=Peronospora matthiolae TaxID=2874970 RepID=A0AAV1UZU2_9STRA
MADVATKKDRNFDRPHDGSQDTTDDRQADHRSKSVRPVVCTIHELTTNEGAGDQSREEAGSSPGETMDDEPDPRNDQIARELDIATCNHVSK